MENGRRYQILTARWKLFEENGINDVLAKANDGISRTYSRSSWGDFDSQTGEASVDLAIPDYFPGGLYAINYILMEDIALNRRGVYFTDPQHGLRVEDVVLDEAPATIEIQTTTSDITPPELDLSRITIQAEPTRPEDPNGETRVDITFRVRDNISGYHYARLYLRDPQGGSHSFRHDSPDFYKVYFQGDPTVYQTYFKSVTLPVGSIPGIWGLAEMNVFDKAENILRSDFTEIVRFEVIDPDSQVTVFAIPQALRKVSGDEQEGLAGEALSAPFVVSVLDQNNGAYLGAPVTFMISGGQGTLSVETTATDSAGQATTTLTLGMKPGINTVDAVVAGLLPVTFTARGIGIPDNLTKVSGRDQQGPAGGALADPFVVRVQDLNGNPLRRRPRHFRRFGRGRNAFRRPGNPVGGNNRHGLGRPGGHHPDPGRRAGQKYGHGKSRRPQAGDLQRPKPLPTSTAMAKRVFPTSFCLPTPSAAATPASIWTAAAASTSPTSSCLPTPSRPEASCWPWPGNGLACRTVRSCSRTPPTPSTARP